MCCSMNKSDIKKCSIYHPSIAVALGAVGAVAAIIATTATIGVIASTAGLFAAPALAVGVLTFTIPLPGCWHGGAHRYFFAQALSFALLSGAALAVGIAIGILSTPLIITFAVVSGVVTAAILGKAVYEYNIKQKEWEVEQKRLEEESDSEPEDISNV